MTEPTQAQIEAAARAIFENISDIDGDEADWILLRDDCAAGAKAALTAAAEVGELRSTPTMHLQTNDGYTFTKMLDHGTIERCAQVADKEAKFCSEAENIAASIRALKDKST